MSDQLKYPISWWVAVDGEYEADGPIRRIVYRNIHTDEKLPSHKLPYGAIFESKNSFKGPDGLSLVCVVPQYAEKRENYTYWYLDGRASNCTKPDDMEHRCWVRHGKFGESMHVDKNGNTCQAGAGSIMVQGFHGFLHHDYLIDLDRKA